MNKDILAPIIFSVGCFIFFWLGVPQYDEILTYRSITGERKTLLSERKALKDNVIKLVEQYESHKADIGKLTLLLPQSKQLDQIIEGLQAATSQNGIQLRELTIAGGNESSPDPYITISIKMSVNGNYDSMLNLMKDLEKSLRLYDLTEIGISRDAQSADPVNAFSINISFNSYNLKNAQSK